MDARAFATTIIVASCLGAAGVRAQVEQEIGRVSAVNPAADSRRAASAPERVLFVGNGVYQSERINTNEGGRAHLLFVDQSALTIGPNSTVLLDRFVYDAARDRGALAMQATRGALRFIGGRISKTSEVTIRTPVGTLGIRGGIGLVQINADDSVFVVQVYGQSIRVPLGAGQSVLITRSGFGIRVPGEVAARPIPPAELSALLAQFRGTLSPEALGQAAARGSLSVPDWNGVDWNMFNAILGLTQATYQLSPVTSAGTAPGGSALNGGVTPPGARPPGPGAPGGGGPGPGVPPGGGAPGGGAGGGAPRGHAYGHLHGVPSGPPSGPPRGPPCGGPCR